MNQIEVDEGSEIERAEILLSSLRKEFAQYRSQVERAYSSACSLLARRERGFSNPFEAKLYERRLTNALQDYFRLREEIDWWLEQAREVVAMLEKIERRDAGMNRPIFNLHAEEEAGQGFEEKTDAFIIESELTM